MLGRSTVFSPRKRSTATTLSRLTRESDWAEAGRAATATNTAATSALVTSATDGLERIRGRLRRHAGQRRRQRADDVGVELRARAPPQLAQRLAGRHRPA